MEKVGKPQKCMVSKNRVVISANTIPTPSKPLFSYTPLRNLPSFMF